MYMPDFEMMVWSVSIVCHIIDSIYQSTLLYVNLRTSKTFSCKFDDHNVIYCYRTKTLLDIMMTGLFNLTDWLLTFPFLIFNCILNTARRPPYFNFRQFKISRLFHPVGRFLAPTRYFGNVQIKCYFSALLKNIVSSVQMKGTSKEGTL